MITLSDSGDGAKVNSVLKLKRYTRACFLRATPLTIRVGRSPRRSGQSRVQRAAHEAIVWATSSTSSRVETAQGRAQSLSAAE